MMIEIFWNIDELLIEFILPGKLMATFSPLRCLMFLDKVLKRGWPGNMASSGKNNDLVAPLSGVGTAAGIEKFLHPNL